MAFVVLASLCSTLPALAQQGGGAPASVPAARVAKPATKPASSAATKPARTADSQRTAATFTLEPVAAWVEPVPVEQPLVAALPKAPIQYLLIDRQTRLDKNDEAHFVRSIRQITDSAGLEAGSQWQVEFDPSYQTLALNRLEVWRNGARIDKLDRRRVQLLQRESDLEQQMLDGRMTASIVLDDIRVGDRIELAYTLRGSNPVFEGRFAATEWTLNSRGPIALMRYRLLVPDTRQVQVRADAGLMETSSSERAHWHETIVRRTNAPQFHYDSNAPAVSWQQDLIQVSEYADWADVARWAARVFAAPLNAPAPGVKEQAETLRQAAGDDPAERVRKTLDFVQTEVRYFGTEIGPNSHRPAEPDKVLKQRFGDCKDKVTLLAALLKAQGLSATPVLVSTSFRGDVAGLLPSPLAFNHVIARVAVGKDIRLLDATRSQQRGPLAEREPLHLGRGLPADDATTDLLTLPTGIQKVRIAGEDRIVVDRFTSDPTLEAQLTYFGDDAEGMRYTLAARPAAEVEKQFVADFARHYQGAELAEPMHVEELDGHNALQVKLRFKLPGFWQMEDPKVLTGSWALPVVTQMLRLPDQAPRTQPLSLGLPGIYQHSVDVQFPEEVFSREIRQPFDLVDKNFELHSASQVRKDGVHFDAELRLLSDRVEAADWPGHRAQLQKIWPKLMGTVNVPTVSTRQAALVGDKAKAFDQEARRTGKMLKTKVQVNAQITLWLDQARLDSDRLAPKWRAKVLVDRGIQQDHLGLLSDATRSFDEAIQLDPRNGEAYAAMSVNALMRRDDALAIEQATKAIELAPSDNSPRYTRAFARYYAGDTTQARDEWLQILKNRNDVERGYAALWLHLTTQRLGGDAQAATQAFQPSGAKPSWPFPVLQVYNGSGTMEQALEAARADKDEADGRLCELYFFMGQQKLLNGDRDAAREYFRKAVATGVIEFTEYSLAQRELQRLGAGKP